MFLMRVRVMVMGSLLLAQAAGQPHFPQSDQRTSSQASYARGIDLTRKGEFTKALDEFQRAAGLDPRNPKIHNMLGAVLSQLGRHTEANEAFNRALALAPNFYPARKNRATNAFLKQDFRFAAIEFEDLARLQPKDSVPQQFLGLLALEATNFQKARTHLLRARQLAPGEGRILGALVHAHFMLGERQLAIDAAREMLTKSNANSADRFETGVLLARFEANAEAAEFFMDLWRQRSGSYEVGFNLALLQYRSNQFEPALRTIEQMLTHGSRQAELSNLRGWIYSRLGRQDLAIASFRQALAAEPGRAEHYLDLSTVLMNLGDWLAAERVISEGIEKDAEKDRLHVQMGLFYKRNNDFHQAETWYRKALEANPTNEAAYIALAHLQLVAGREGEALALLQNAIRRLPTSPLLSYVYGSLLLESTPPEDIARVENARLALEKALTLNPLFASTHYRLGRLFLLRGDEEKAQQYFERACSLNPEHAEALFQLSRILARCGQKDRAAELRRAVRDLRTEKDRLIQELAGQSLQRSTPGELVGKPKN